LNGKTLRQLALKGIEETRWYPARGANRIGADGGRAARLGAVAPARLGRATGDFSWRKRPARC